MAGLFGGGRSNAQQQTIYTGVQIQTSAEGVPIAIVWGANRIAPNLVWTDNFSIHQSSGGKKGGGKGGGKGGSKTYAYSAGVVLACCEGPITQFGIAFKDRTDIEIASLGLTEYQGTIDQTAFPAVASAGYVPVTYTQTAYLATNNYDLGSGATLPNHGIEIYGFRSGASIPGSFEVAPADCLYDLLTSTQYGMGLSPSALGDMTAYDNACRVLGIGFSPALTQQEQARSIIQRWAQLSNAWIFWSGNQMKFVPLLDVAMSGNGHSYTPNLTPQYALSYEDFVTDQGTAPITVERSDQASAYNWITLQVRDRNTQYSAATVEYKDQTAIDLYGLTQPNTVTANEICDRNIAATVVALIGRRAVSLRNTYRFKLGYNFVLLEPGDIVTLSDAHLGLDALAVRISSIEEDESGTLAFEAEECPFGTGLPAIATPQPWAGVPPPSQDIDPGPVNPPAILEPPSSVTGGVAQIWIGASGGVNWGGADVYASVDDVTYAPIGTIQTKLPQGVLRASLPAGTDPDTTHTLAVDLTLSQMTLTSSITHADADAARVTALVDHEVIGYGQAVPNGAGAFDFDLTYLRRGLYGTSSSTHSAGAPFSAIAPGSMLQVALPAEYIGKTVYLKLTSFNVYGGATEDISTVTRYSYTPSGIAYPATTAPPTLLIPLVNGDTNPAGFITDPSGVPVYVGQT